MVKEVTNFYTLYKTPNRENIVEINRMVDHFPIFVFQVINKDLFEKVSKDIIQYKLLRHYGWPVEFFSRFL